MCITHACVPHVAVPPSLEELVKAATKTRLPLPLSLPRPRARSLSLAISLCLPPYLSHIITHTLCAHTLSILLFLPSSPPPFPPSPPQRTHTHTRSWRQTGHRMRSLTRCVASYITRCTLPCRGWQMSCWSSLRSLSAPPPTTITSALVPVDRPYLAPFGYLGTHRHGQDATLALVTLVLSSQRRVGRRCYFCIEREPLHMLKRTCTRNGVKGGGLHMRHTSVLPRGIRQWCLM